MTLKVNPIGQHGGHVTLGVNPIRQHVMMSYDLTCCHPPRGEQQNGGCLCWVEHDDGTVVMATHKTSNGLEMDSTCHRWGLPLGELSEHMTHTLIAEE